MAAGDPAEASQVLRRARRELAPDAHVVVFDVGVIRRGCQLVLTGEVDRAEAKIGLRRAFASAGWRVADEIRLLPDLPPGTGAHAVCVVSVGSARERPAHGAEMGTQALMGETLQVLDRTTSRGPAAGWLRVRSADGYVSWIEEGSVRVLTDGELLAWTTNRQLMVTALESSVVDSSRPGSTPVSDVVVGDRLRLVAEQGDWFQVALPDGRSGFLPRDVAEELPTWLAGRRATSEAVEATARRFLGRPYLWGGCSSKGLDCSGFTQLVFRLNGVEVPRNAAEQAFAGREVLWRPRFEGMLPGDLLLFGRAAGDGAGKIVHVGIYLGEGRFIHSLGWVHISSLDPASALADPARIKTLRQVRRVLPEKAGG